MGCEKESIVDEMQPPQINMVDIITYDPYVVNGIQYYLYVGYYQVDSAGVTSLDKFNDNYNQWLLTCTQCNEDYYYIHNLTSNTTSYLSNPDFVINSTTLIIDNSSSSFNDANSPIGDGSYYLYPYDIDISLNNNDTVILFN
tara:strand:+ start:11157 stop:11582 length:426 start_codon:yes stop_codon:yes gene_type:complete